MQIDILSFFRTDPEFASTSTALLVAIVGWILTAVSRHKLAVKEAIKEAKVAKEKADFENDLSNSFSVSMRTVKKSKDFLEAFVDITETSSKRNKIVVKTILQDHQLLFDSKSKIIEEEIEFEPNHKERIILGEFLLAAGWSSSDDIYAKVILSSSAGKVFLEKNLSHPYRESF